MRREFIGHHPLSPDEVDRLWSSALVVVDTNVLLSFYKLSVDARKKLMSVLEEFQDRLWIPYQVGEEFHRNRVDRIRDQRGMGDKLGSTLESFKKTFAVKLQDFSQNPFFETSSLQAKWEKLVDDFRDQVRDMHSSKMAKYAITPQNDPVLSKLANLYDGRVGAEPAGENLEKLYSTAQARFDKKIPPGYEDAKSKQPPYCYGDFILWSQILDHAREDACDVLFVTDDQKSDWWWQVGGETLGPEPQLRREFAAETGKIFYAYRSNQLVRIFDERRSVAVDEAVVEEIRVVGEQVEKSGSKRSRRLKDLAKMVEFGGGSGVPVGDDVLLSLIGGLRESEALNTLQSAYDAEDRLRNLTASCVEKEGQLAAVEARVGRCENATLAARDEGNEARLAELEKELQNLISRRAQTGEQLNDAHKALAIARVESARAKSMIEGLRSFLSISPDVDEEDVVHLLHAIRNARRRLISERPIVKYRRPDTLFDASGDTE